MASNSPRTGFWYIAEDEPHRPALHLPDGSTRSFGELRDAANRLAHGLGALGLAAGDVVVASLENGETYYALHLAAMQSGLYFTAANHHLTDEELAYILTDSEASVIVCSPTHAATCEKAAELARLEAPRRFVEADRAMGSMRPLREMTQGQSTELPTERVPGKVMAYTSGTTGRARGDGSDTAAPGLVRWLSRASREDDCVDGEQMRDIDAAVAILSTALPLAVA
jgi:long-chain acyl-CoA synthetase